MNDKNKSKPAPRNPGSYVVVKDFFLHDSVQGLAGDQIDLPEVVAAPLIESGHIK